MKNNMKSWWVYVLELEEGKYYVGISTDVEKRYKQHQNGFAGAAWTKKYKPIGILDKKFLGEINKEDAEKYEDKVTRAYIKKYGIKNVRGGDFKYSGDYVRLFTYYFLDKDYEAIKVVLVLTITMLFFAILYYLK